MLLDAVIIVLREVLEAAMLASIFLATSRVMGLRFHWFIASLVCGVLGAYWYAANMDWISALFDYTGQERFNSGIQIAVYVSAVCVTFGIALWHRNVSHARDMVTLLMALTVAIAFVREGSEIFLYTKTFVGDQAKFTRVLMGGIVGASIGASVGVIAYYALIVFAGARSVILCQVALAVVASGILSQVVPMLEQVDILPSTAPLWDSSGLVSENSVVGQLLYAMVGYESTPSAWQVGVYGSGMALFAALLVFDAMFGGRTDEV